MCLGAADRGVPEAAERDSTCARELWQAGKHFVTIVKKLLNFQLVSTFWADFTSFSGVSAPIFAIKYINHIFNCKNNDI